MVESGVMWYQVVENMEEDTTKGPDRKGHREQPEEGVS